MSSVHSSRQASLQEPSLSGCKQLKDCTRGTALTAHSALMHILVRAGNVIEEYEKWLGPSGQSRSKQQRCRRGRNRGRDAAGERRRPWQGCPGGWVAGLTRVEAQVVAEMPRDHLTAHTALCGFARLDDLCSGREDHAALRRHVRVRARVKCGG